MYIFFKELGTVMRRLGDNPTDEELRVMVAEVDQVGRKKTHFLQGIELRIV